MHMRSTITSAQAQPAVRPAEIGPDMDFGTDMVTIPVKLCNLPPLNAVANQVLALTTDPDIELGQISRVVGGDPAFAADILFLANSSLFGFPSRMHNLRHAIALLGLDRIKALAVTVAMRGFLGHRNPLIHQCWQHSVACAAVCEELAALCDFSGDRAYTAGIMHDIGRLGLLKAYPNDMKPILTGQTADTEEVLRAEREALGVDHAQAGAWLVRTWALPKDFPEICEHHHDAPNENDSEVLHLVKAACNIANIVGFPAVNCIRQPSYEEATAPLLRPGRNAVPSVEDLRANVTVKQPGSSQR